MKNDDLKPWGREVFEEMRPKTMGGGRNEEMRPKTVERGSI